MIVARLFLVEFGAFLLLFVALLGRQILARELAAWKRQGMPRIGAEGWVLAVVSTLTAVRYLWEFASHGLGLMPELSTGWLTVFGAGCVVYLGTKVVRMLGIQSE